MARIRSGVLGNTRGKVAGIVGSQWKDKNYIREYVKPANPNTAAQQTQRTKMSDVVAFCKPLVGPVFNAYTDKFQKSMSGFNFFIKRNIDVYDGSPNLADMKLTEGKLHAPTVVAGAYTNGVADIDITWVESLGNNGSLTDKMYAAAYQNITKLWYFASAEVDRDAETLTIVGPTDAQPSNFEIYLWAIQYSGTIVNIISNAVWGDVT